MSSNNFIDEVCCSVSKMTMLQTELQKDLGLISNGERERVCFPGSQINWGRAQTTNSTLH